MTAELEIRPIAGALGAEVSGLDAGSVDQSVADQLLKALTDHHVLFLPGLDPSTEQLRDIGALFGPLETIPYLPKVDDTIPEVDVLSTASSPAADVWHTDATFLETPPTAALLRMVDGPEYGSDTTWINCHAVYDSLSAPLQALLEGLTCIHDDSRGDLKAEHPVVRVHPDTGRRALFVSKQFSRRIPQLSRPESQMLLTHLFRWQEQVKFSCRWRWSNGDVAIWDERVTLHAVVHDSDAPRTLHRCSVIGDRPVGVPDAAEWSRHATPKNAASSFYGVGNYEF